MIEKKAIVQSETGLHARPALVLSKLCARFKSTITLEHGTMSIDPKSLLSIMKAGISQGSEILVKADGLDEIEAIDAIVGFINTHNE